MKLHIGRGTDRGALTVFPVWGEYAGARGYDLGSSSVTLAERSDGPTVGALSAANAGARPALMLEGQLLEGGWQHRMLARSVLVPARGATDLDVVCVEQGRWDGSRGHRAGGRRASMRVRSGGEQGEVWRRVAEYDARFGPNATSSYLEHADRAQAEVAQLVEDLRPFPGQVGVVVGIAGQPAMLEAFDNPLTLRRQFDAIVRAAALDALGREEVRTPSRRAFRFAERVTAVPQRPRKRAGAGVTVGGSSTYAAVTGLAWQGRRVHLAATNRRHPLNLPVAVG